MRAERIRELATYIPEDSDYYGGFPSISVSSCDVSKWIHRFVVCYKDLSFGYNFVKALVRADKKLPLSVSERYLREAFKFEKTGKADSHILEAYMYFHPSNKFFRNLLEGMLVIPDLSFKEMTQKTGISEKTIRAYEQLFYNVRDRQSEAAFIASIVYPEGRIVETEEGYHKNEDPGMIMKRSAYNNGFDDLAWFSGLKTDYLSCERSVDMAEKLESAIMANGYYLARNGFINQRSATGVQNAKNIISASKQSGNAPEAHDDVGVGSLGDAFFDSYMQDNKERMDSYLENRKQISDD